jgi:hypothetical protein
LRLKSVNREQSKHDTGARVQLNHEDNDAVDVRLVAGIACPFMGDMHPKGNTRRPTMKMISRRSRCAPALLALAGLASSAVGSASPFFFYKFTPIADTLPGFPYTILTPFPSINSSGRVAFSGTLTGGVEGVFTRLGTGGVNTLADSGVTPFRLFGLDTSINSLNRVAFTALDPDNFDTILRGEGNSATQLIKEGDSNHLSQFCGLQMNNEDSVAFLALRSDGKHEVRTQGAGPLNGVHRTIAVEGSEFSGLGCAPSIAHDGTVAFTGTRNGHRAIFTRDEAGQLTIMIDDSSGFLSFNDIALNQFGGLAFTSTLPGGAHAVHRLKGGVITKLMDTNQPNAGGFPVGVALNESGTVAFELSRDANGSQINLGPNSLFGRIVGTGNLLFNNRMVFAAHLGRDAINSTGQVVVSLVMFDGSTVIARGDPTNIFDTIRITGGLVLTAAAEGGAGAGTSLPTPPKGAVMTFDLTFLALDSQVDVTLGGKVVQSIRASDVGVRKTVSVPLDPALARGGLQIALVGKTGASAQIAAVTIPGLSEKPLDAAALAKWKADDSRKGGVVSVIEVARYPVKVQLAKSTTDRARTPGTTLVNATIFSDASVDASADLMLASLRVGGAAPRPAKGGPECKASDVDGDKLPDLTCAVEVPDTVLKAGAVPIEAWTQSGWAIEGANALGATRLGLRASASSG